MGTRRLWIALLLAVLQYAAIADGLKICQIAPRSDCTGPDVQAKLPTNGGPCTELSGRPPVCGGGGLLMFFNANGAFGWSEVEDLQCTGIGEWSIMKPTTIKLDDSDNIICAADLPKCTQCAPLVPGTLCDAAKGCIADVPAAASGVEPDTACLKMTCAGGGFFITDAPSQEDDLNVIKCDANGAWATQPDIGLAVVVTKAVCVKNYLCSVMSPPKDACSTLPSHIQCKKVPLIDGAINKCIGLGLKMFYKKTGKPDWKEETGDKMKCIETTGKWELEPSLVSIIAGDEVVCADKSPDTLAPAISCTAGNALVSNCGPTPADAAKCIPIQQAMFDADSSLSCSSGKLYWQKPDNTWVSSARIDCDKTDGKWKEGAMLDTELHPNANVVCAARDPKPEQCTDKNTLTSACPSPSFAVAECGQITLPDNGGLLALCSAKKLYAYRGSTWAVQEADIKCDGKTGKWMEAVGTPVEFTIGATVVCAKDDPSPRMCTAAATPLTSDCPTISATRAACKITPIVDASLKCKTPGSDYLFVLKNGLWTAAPDNKIECDITTGEWKTGLSLAALDGDSVVCAASDPGPISCMAGPDALKSVCPPGSNPNAKCAPVAVSDDILSALCTNGKVLYVKPPAAAGQPSWVPATGDIKCDRKTGKWEQGTSSMTTLDATNVVCAEGDPTPLTVLCTKDLTTDCDPTWPPAIGCVEPIIVPSVVCPSLLGNQKLYFKKAGVSAFQEAKSVDCETTWKLKYKFGNIDKDAELVTGDHLICAVSNPDPEVCQFPRIRPSGTKYVNPTGIGASKKFEAGEVGKCDNVLHDFVNEKGDDRRNNDSIVCNVDGSWSAQNGDEFGEKDKVGCALPKCKDCPSVQENQISYPTHVAGAMTINTDGTCSVIKCKDTELRFTILEDGETTYTTSVKSPVCDATQRAFMFDDGKKKVGTISCAQKLYCIDPNFVQVKRTCADAREVTDCEDPVLVDISDTVAETLTCKSPRKMFIRNDLIEERYWEEVKKLEIKCDDDLGKWIVDLVDEAGKPKQERRDYQNTIICTGANPQPKSTTTTTTTTPPPLRPICDVCRDALDELDLVTCETCNNATKLEEPNHRAEYGPGDICELKPGDGRDLLINNFEQVHGNNPLVCKRGEPGEKVQWKTTEGTPVSRYSSRLETKKDSWKALSYVVVGAVFVAIGGMGITCVVIFMKMRKQPSSREKKKKERGVTKKYTSSNVVKTGHKSMAATSREGGKSKDGSASKMEDNNEDTPTLKL